MTNYYYSKLKIKGEGGGVLCSTRHLEGNREKKCSFLVKI